MGQQVLDGIIQQAIHVDPKSAVPNYLGTPIVRYKDHGISVSFSESGRRICRGIHLIIDVYNDRTYFVKHSDMGIVKRTMSYLESLGYSRRNTLGK